MDCKGKMPNTDLLLEDLRLPLSKTSVWREGISKNPLLGPIMISADEDSDRPKETWSNESKFTHNNS